jgi:hypothetical protein
MTASPPQSDHIRPTLAPNANRGCWPDRKVAAPQANRLRHARSRVVHQGEQCPFPTTTPVRRIRSIEDGLHLGPRHVAQHGTVETLARDASYRRRFEPLRALLGKSATNVSANDLMWEFFQMHGWKTKP